MEIAPWWLFWPRAGNSPSSDRQPRRYPILALDGSGRFTISFQNGRPSSGKQLLCATNSTASYVQKRLPLNRSRDTTPAPRNPPRLSQQLESFARQAGILARRYSRLQLADLRSLGTFFGQCVLVALLLVIFYGDLDGISLLPKKASQCGNLVFLLGISCLWFGCNNAAKEIVKERVIYLRERDVNVTIPSYYFSKLFLLGLLCLFQTTLLLGIVKYFTNLPGGFLGQWLSLVTLALVGVSLGLLISALSKTTDNAVAMVPAVLLPQIILAGVIAPVEGFAKLLAQLFISAIGDTGPSRHRCRTIFQRCSVRTTGQHRRRSSFSCSIWPCLSQQRSAC